MKQIPPGGEGLITVKVSTKNDAGKTIREVVRIQTNDDSQPGLNVVVTGSIEAFAQIKPKRVSLNGKVGEPIKSEIIIQSSEKYPFEITNIKSKYGKFVKYQLERLKKSCPSRLESDC